MRSSAFPQWVFVLAAVALAVAAYYGPRPQPEKPPVARSGPNAPAPVPLPWSKSPAPVAKEAAYQEAVHEEHHHPEGEICNIVRVADGDTLEVQPPGGARFRVRLQGVDCPELQQPYGDDALRFTLSHVRGKEVQLSRLGTDQFGRVLGVVTVDGENLNRTIVAAGYGWCFRRYAEDPELLKLEAAAKSAKRGLWAQAKPQAPWEYRQEHGTRRDDERKPR